MNDNKMSRVQARQALEAAAFGGPLDQAVTQVEVADAKLLLAAATIKPMRAENAVAIGALLERYEALVNEVRQMVLARDQDSVLFWTCVSKLTRMVGDGR